MTKTIISIGIAALLASCSSASDKAEESKSNGNEKAEKVQVKDSLPVSTGRLSEAKKLDTNNQDKNRKDAGDEYLVPNRKVNPQDIQSLSRPEIFTQIEKKNSGEWILTYRLKKPAKALAFSRNPDSSRQKRWQPITDNVEIILKEEKELVVNKFGKEFSIVQFKLTPTYAALPKDYAPFSPFSDGGVLLHSARFFACVDECIEDDNNWKIQLRVENSDNIIVNGEIHKSSVQWDDSDSGRNIYVGQLEPLESERLIALIDPGLPTLIRNSLRKDIPKMMTYFEEKLGKLSLKDKPSLFASYAKIKDGHTQGGTLPGQIFMHWNTDNLQKRSENQSFVFDTVWFFAHEVAHLYQSTKKGQLNHEPNHSWIHEGNAEYLAYKYLNDSYMQDSYLQNSHSAAKEYTEKRLKKSEETCTKNIGKASLNKAAEKGQFSLYYSCGFLLHRAIDRKIRQINSDNDIFTLWNRYQNDIDSGAKAGDKVFLLNVEKLTNKRFKEKVISALASQSIDEILAL